MGLLPTTLCRCRLCKADEDSGEARTVVVVEGGLSVTWHLLDCPHYQADRVLAGREP
ncbi:hypothetical protein ACQKM2_13315 [Streptomyces sp. NPDC004126]|uniref:hypothetical protein n=1 Tax=Streptomyces sp. NPDC004126 TaxID=3390695 RepID=UPI003D02BCBE